jgi:uncharacterized protein (TIGR02391 family)
LLDREGIDLATVLPEISESLLVYDRLAGSSVPRGDLHVTLRGLALCSGAADDLALFLCALKLCVERERLAPLPTPTPTPNESAAVVVTAADVRAVCQRGKPPEDPRALTRVFLLLQTLHPIWNAATGPTDEGWSLTLTRGIRVYRSAETVEDVIRVQAEQAAPPPGPPHIIRRPRSGLVTPIPEFGGETEAAPPVPAKPSPRTSESSAGAPRTAGLAASDLHSAISAAAADLLSKGHPSEAVHQATLAFLDVLRQRSALNDEDGDALVGKALAWKEGKPRPRVVVADLRTRSGKSRQRGALLLAQGIVAALRNPTAHQREMLSPTEAMEMVGLISLVTRWVDTRTRRRRPTQPRPVPPPAGGADGSGT